MNIIKEVYTVETFNKIKSDILGILKENSSSNIIRLVVLLALYIAWKLISRELKKILVEKAKKLSEYEREKLREYLASIAEGDRSEVVISLEEGF